ncbi:MAG: VWA domain-containing protein [Acidobacteria bacterium]|nr:VWA domain-containing protein [Acidobacteriota bacterium]
MAQPPPRIRPLQERGLRLRAGVDLVRLSVTAQDEAQAIVHDLRPEEFQVFEDGEAQEVAHFGHHESPISVVVLFDKSGSMADEKLMHAKDAVINFVRALTPQDEVLIMAFSGGSDVLGRFGRDGKTIEREVKRIRIESSTRLYDAAIDASRAIASPDRKEKRAILILSDGEDTASAATLDQASEAVRRAEVPVYAIGIELEDQLRGPWAADSLWTRLRGPSAIEALKRLTDGTGGWTYPIVAAKRCKEVCLLVADELRNQYLLGYYPTNQARDGRWRAISVKTTRPGVRLATRSGYYAPQS